MNFLKLDRYLDSLLSQGLPMYDCTVHVDYREVYRRQGGYIDVAAGVRHRPDTRYFMYSATKPVTCTTDGTTPRPSPATSAGRFWCGEITRPITTKS